MADRPLERASSFAQHAPPSLVDRAGRALSQRRMARYLGGTAAVRAADIGCGHDAALAQSLFKNADHVLLVDIAVAAELAALQNIEILEGRLPEVLEEVEDDSFDRIICNNVIEHLWQPLDTVSHLRRMLAPGGVCVINVPSWLGKRALEFAAFRLHVAPAAEMNDHKAYYDPRELWTLLVHAGFAPEDITCVRHKFGLNTIARCRKGLSVNKVSG